MPKIHKKGKGRRYLKVLVSAQHQVREVLKVLVSAQHQVREVLKGTCFSSASKPGGTQRYLFQISVRKHAVA
jgi:hypothetical protein